MTRVTGIRMLEGSMYRSGHGDNWHTTWANNDKQYVLLADGRGWPEAVGDTRKVVDGELPYTSFNCQKVEILTDANELVEER